MGDDNEANFTLSVVDLDVEFGPDPPHLSQNSSMDERELDSLVSDCVPVSTSRATKWGLNKWHEWLNKRGKVCDFHTVSADELNVLLRKFYAELRSTKKKDLTPSSLTGIRAALHRAIRAPPYNRAINIVGDAAFNSANVMFTTKCKQYVKNGNQKPKHKPAIVDSDLKLLGIYFQGWMKDPVILQEYVWFSLCFNFGRRGREGWAEMTKDSFDIETDNEGNRFVKESKTEKTKNHQGGSEQSKQDYSTRAMYGTPVDVFDFFLDKLHPNCARLFQQPLKSYNKEDSWFTSRPVGKNALSNMMQTISRKSGLSQTYTCHSVRASMITTLFHAGVSPHIITQMTKHRNESSLKHYVDGMSKEQNMACNTILQDALGAHEENPTEKVNFYKS